MFSRTLQVLQLVTYLAFWSAALPYSTPPPTDQIEQIRRYTRDIEFDYLRWTAAAAWIKLQAGSAGLPHAFPPAAQTQIMNQYLQVTQQVFDNERLLEAIYADPAIGDKESASTALRRELAALATRQAQLGPLAESILQEQVSHVLVDLDLALGGQPVPPVLYHVTPVPMALIVSRRDRIEQLANISIEADLTLEQEAALESRVDRGLDLSSLVVPIGGVGVYPTMVTRSTDLRWLTETIAHEWTHNFLTLRPLGALYDSSSELRTMNETAANISGTETSLLVMSRFYPQPQPSSAARDMLITIPYDHPDPGDLPRPQFDFRLEMHETRVTTDGLLADGKIGEAEAYMESRRLLFLQHGFVLRKINQAYFAFYGAYADVPGGAAGEDPVGPAVRLLRQQSRSLSEFLNRISWFTSFEQLQTALSTP